MIDQLLTGFGAIAYILAIFSGGLLIAGLLGRLIFGFLIAERDSEEY